MSSLFGGKPKSPSIPAIEPTPPPEKVVPVTQVSQKEEEDVIRKTLAKRRRATFLSQNIESAAKIYRQRLGAAG